VSDEPASVHFDRAAEFYDATRAVDDETTRRSIDLLAGEVSGRGRVLEIGVGTGLMALPLAERGVDVTGVDLSEPMLRQLIRKASGRVPFPLLRADATHLPFGDGVFGAAYARHVLHLVPNWRVAVGELCRVVGHGVVLIEAGGSSDGDWHDVWQAMRDAVGPAADHVGLDMSAEGRALLDQAFTEAGAVPRDLPEIPYTDDETIATMIEQIERRSASWTWRASDEQLSAAIDAARKHALERYGSLDVSPDERAYVRWRAFDLT
jgi:ubiquinone/menaquinone biosynthesis C-methylase UbiE